MIDESTTRVRCHSLLLGSFQVCSYTHFCYIYFTLRIEANQRTINQDIQVEKLWRNIPDEPSRKFAPAQLRNCRLKHLLCPRPLKFPEGLCCEMSGLVTSSILFCFLFCEKSITPVGQTLLLSSKQLPPLKPLLGFLS